MSQEEKLLRAKAIIENSRYLVCLLGMRVSSQCGCTNWRSDQDAYDIETRYGCSPEEMFSAEFYNTRVTQFYDFYKREILSKRGRINDGMKSLKRLEDRGILQSIITRDIYSLPKRAGCKKVLEIHGSIYRNVCPKCRTKYPMKAVAESVGTPKCTKCGTTIRPEVCLRGEMVDNSLLTRAVDEVGMADTLLILGSRMHSQLAKTYVKYFEGDKIILINDQDHYADDAADLVIDGKAMEIMSKLEL